MRYFLVTFVDENLRVFLRDNMRGLGRFRRNLYIKDSQEYYLIIKYLGEKLSTDEVGSVNEVIEDFVKNNRIRQFGYETKKLKVGKKSELVPTTIYMELEQTTEMNLLFRLLHQQITSLGIDRIPRRKDHNKFLGLVKIAQIRPNISQRDLADLQIAIREFPQPPEILFNNFTIIGVEVVKTKTKLHKLFTINLDE
jgi:hypothetical protein